MEMDTKCFFNKIAFEWDNMSKHDDNKLKRIMRLSSVKENSKILDIGTGTGILISYLLDTNPECITALDVSENMLTVAKGKYKDSRIEFICKDIMDYSNSSKGYDYIFLYSVYPHIQDKEALFIHLLTLMNIGGKLIIAHSESKEKINEVHRSSKQVCKDMLPSGDATASTMSKYLKVSTVIDNDEMYYVCGIKE